LSDSGDTGNVEVSVGSAAGGRISGEDGGGGANIVVRSNFAGT